MRDFVKFNRAGDIAVLTLDRPETLNAIGDYEDCADIIGALEALEADRSIRVAILTGAGRAFCAGGNLKGIQERNGIGPLEQPDSTRWNYRRGVARIARAFMDCEAPLIAAINGHAIGLGLDLACYCDLRVAAEGAPLASSFVKVGITPGDGGAWALQQIVGYSRAAEMILTGRTYRAEEAAEFGLVGRVVPAERLMDEAMALAREIAANPPRAVKLSKRLLREAQHSRLADILELSAAFQALAHETADHREAVAAILDKREGRFTGQ